MRPLVAFAFTVLLSATAVAAPNAATKECISAFDQGQHLKSDHHLKEAHTQLLACTKETCPSVLRADCAEVLRSVDAALPSVVLAADDAGKDVTDVKVSNGGEVLTTSLDARAIELDPGEYDFVYEHGANPPLTVHFVLREGEKNRIVKASFNPKKPAPVMRLETPPRTTVGYIVPAGAAVIGITSLVLAGLSKMSFAERRDEMIRVCQPVCTQENRDDLSGRLVRANIELGIGIGALVVAAVTWFIFSPSPRLVGPAGPTTAALSW